MTDKEIEILKQILGNYIPTKNGRELNFLCPFPHCNKHKKKLAINKGSGNWHCWSCERKGVEPDYLVARFGSFDQKKIWGELTKQIDFSLLQEFLFPTEREKKKTDVWLPREFVSLVGNHSMSVLAARNFLENRGVTEEQICLWKAGFCHTGRYADRIIFPSFDIDGNLNYFVARNISEDAEYKYDNPPADKKNIIFNELLIDFRKPVVLLEGVFDSMLAGNNSIPLLGSFLRADYLLLKRIVENKTPVYLAIDPDALKKERAMIKLFREHDVPMKKIDILPFKDVGAMPSREEFERRKSLANPVKDDSLLQSMILEV